MEFFKSIPGLHYFSREKDDIDRQINDNILLDDGLAPDEINSFTFSRSPVALARINSDTVLSIRVYLLYRYAMKREYLFLKNEFWCL